MWASNSGVIFTTGIADSDRPWAATVGLAGPAARAGWAVSVVATARFKPAEGGWGGFGGAGGAGSNGGSGGGGLGGVFYNDNTSLKVTGSTLSNATAEGGRVGLANGDRTAAALVQLTGGGLLLAGGGLPVAALGAWA